MANTSQAELTASLIEPFIAESPDGTSRIQVEVDETTPDFTRVVTEVQYPEALDPFDFISALDQPQRSLDHPIYELLLLGRPDGQLESFEAVERFRPVIQGLGYSTKSTTGVHNSTISTKLEFTYPSVDALNVASGRLFPSMPLRFKEFAGGKFDAEEFLTSLAEDGEVLVATEQPWVLHDHAVRHVLGYLALGEEFVDQLRKVTGQYLARLLGERALPPVALAEGAGRGFLRPSRLAIGGILGKLDVLSASIPNHILYTEPYISVDMNQSEGEFLRFFEHFWEDGSTNRFREEVPRGFLGGSSRDFDERTASEVWLRYESAEAKALASASQ